MADPTSVVDMMMGAGGGAGGTGIIGYALYKAFGGKQESTSPPPVCPAAPTMHNMERRMERMVELQTDGNVLLAEIKGVLSRVNGHG